jgi:polynucleotide 5'-hydroxyl-kinase GRC3/NOL9
MQATTLHIPFEWREASEEMASGGGPVMVIGGPGSGKTTFCLYLAGSLFREKKRVAWIDADPGQPFIGPPAAFSLARFSEIGDLEKRKSPQVMGFIGNTSPVGHLLEAVTSIQKLCHRAVQGGADLVLVNTCGMVGGGAARELLFHEIEAIAPRYLVALQEKSEVEHLLAPHAHRAGLLIQRLPPSPDARVTTSEARKAYREQRFKEYFRGAEYLDISLSDVGVHGPGLGTGERLGFRDVNLLSKLLRGLVIHAELSSDRLFVVTDGDYSGDELFEAKERYRVREITAVKRSELEYLLVGLNDDRNYCLALGIIREFDVREFGLRIITPLRDSSAVRHLSFGSLRVNPAGTELGLW